ncbi:MAG TPA: nitrate- and nitrite sensing domain-containing protein, partial [Gammaproteobacteria bacterium]|nr:nitrate- and nitrite sensing domain-containing protein [Gammaproteobacteria bacterium]
MHFLKNISLNRKLLVMLLAPCLGLSLFAGSEVVRTLKLKTEADSLLSLTELSVLSSALVHELQKERGASAGYLGSKGERFVEELPAQRGKTDRKITELRDLLGAFEAASFGADFVAELNGATDKLDKIAGIRKQVTALDIPTGEAIGYYAAMNGAF